MMDYNDIIENGHLVYKSMSQDVKLRDWRILKTTCRVTFYNTVPLSDLESILLRLLKSLEDRMITKEDFGLILGFDLANKKFGSKRFYKDESEECLYQSMISSLFQWNLITEESVVEKGTEESSDDTDKKKNIRLTKLGQIAQEKNCKFSFFSGLKVLVENINNSSLEEDSTFFPFFSDLGEYTEITSVQPWKDYDADKIDIYNETDLIKRIKLQSNKDLNIFDAYKINEWAYSKYDVDIHIYKHGGDFYPIVFNNGRIAEKASNILYRDENYHLRNYKTKKALYYKLINQTDSVINYDEIKYFENEIEQDEFDFIINDQRTDWFDNATYSFISGNKFCNERQWEIISRQCPTDVIMSHLLDDDSHFDFMILSSRLPISFIIDKSADYPWDMNIVMSRKDITKQQAQTLMISEVNSDIEWDWELTEPYLDLRFVLDNIQHLNIDYYNLTSWLPYSNYNLVVDYSDREWNWFVFARHADIELIIDNISSLSDHVKKYIGGILDRIFTSSDSIKKVLANDEFTNLLRDYQENDVLLSFDLSTKRDYLWDNKLIDYLESCNILTWNTDEYKKGFAQYSYVNWNREFFARYHKKVANPEDLSHISRLIDSLQFVIDNPDYSWDWHALSANPHLATNEELLELGKERIDYEAWLTNIGEKFTNDYFISHKQWMTSPINSTFVSRNICGFEPVIQNESFPWDWISLAQNDSIINDEQFCRNLDKHVDALPIWLSRANHILIEKYFHAFKISDCINAQVGSTQTTESKRDYLWYKLSQSLSPEFISQNLSENWNNEIISRRIVHILEKTPEVLNIHRNVFDWDILSNEMTVEFIQENILEYKNQWNWTILSCRLEPEFIHENFKTFSNKWNQELIQCAIIPLLSADEVLDQTFSSYWDWQVISEKLPNESLISVLVQKADRLNWHTISNRICESDTVFISKVLTECTNVSDYLLWDILSSDIPLSDILSNRDTANSQWDWTIITRRFDTDFLISNLSTYADYWDWNVILSEKLNPSFLKDNLEKLKDSLSSLPSDKRQYCWRTISRIYKSDELLEITESYSPIIGYEWDYSYAYQAIKDPEDFIRSSHVYVDWTAFSSCKAVDQMFEFDSEIYSFRAWKTIVKNKLKNDVFKWDYSALTRLESIQQKHEVFYSFFPEKWDWAFISQYGTCLLKENNRDKYIRKYRDRLNFGLISTREDIDIDDNLIASFIDESWDWNALSSNEMTKLSFRFICGIKEKPWDWSALSKNSSIKWDKTNLRFLIRDSEIRDKISWDDVVAKREILFDDNMIAAMKKINFSWSVLTGNPSFHPTKKTINQAIESGDTIDWDALSDNNHINIDLIREYRSHFNWQILSSNTNVIDTSNEGIVEEFADVLDWSYVSQKLALSMNTLIKFKEKLDWKVVNKRFDYNELDLSDVHKIEKYIDWTKLSEASIIFTERFLEKYRSRIDWYALSKNEAIDLTAPMFSDFSRELNRVKFIDNLDCYSGSYQKFKVYHFSHLFNAIGIIKNRKILNRNKAKRTKQLKSDAAGSVIRLTGKGHSYARFYFRPKSPTQFYNECLGWDDTLLTNWDKPKSYYPQACSLHLPKCPMPVFFEFDVREIIAKMPEKCYYSTGNLQTNFATVLKVDDTPDRIRTEYLYSDMSDAFNLACSGYDYDRIAHMMYLKQIKEQSQQEFLIIDEFDFSAIDSVNIYCYDEEQKRMLTQYLGDDELASKIHVGHWLYTRNNRQLTIEENNVSITISSNYDLEGCAYLLVKGGEIINKKSIRNTSPSGVIIYPSVSFKKANPPKEIYFVDPNPIADTKEFLIYSSTNVMNQAQKQSKFILEGLIKDSIHSFEREMENLPIVLSKELFYKHMIDSYHGIAHTARVLLATHLLVNAIDLDQNERNACYIAAIIHDLGKRSDIEGKEHGYNSMSLYRNRISDLIEDLSLANRVLKAVEFHSVEDLDCPDEVRSDIIWKILKDADALDRSRFRGKGCDKSYLRLGIYNNNIGMNILGLTSYLPAWSKDLIWDKPYQELINQILKNCE